MEQRKTKLIWIFEFAQLIGILFAGVGLLLNYFQFKEEFEYRKQEFEYHKQEAMQAVITNSPDLIDKYREPLDSNKILKRIFNNSNNSPLNDGEALKLAQACSEEEDSTAFSCVDKRAVITILNYMESLCTNYTNDIGDKRMFEESFKDIIMVYYHFFEKFISKYEKFNNLKEGTAWEPFQNFANEMKKQGAAK